MDHYGEFSSHLFMVKALMFTRSCGLNNLWPLRVYTIEIGDHQSESFLLVGVINMHKPFRVFPK